MTITDISNLETAVQELDTASFREIHLKHPHGFEEEKNTYAVWNDQQKSMADIVSRKYTILQHRDAFMPVVDSIRQMGMDFEATVRNSHNRAYLEVVFGKEMIKPTDGNPILLGLKFKNSYDGSSVFKGSGFGYRKICSNGMFGIAGNIGTPLLAKHYGKKILVEAKKISDLFKNILKEKKAILSCINAAIKEYLSEDEMESFIETHITPTDKHLKAILERVGGNNKWDLYNAITNYSTHEIQNEATKELYQKKALALIKVRR